MIAKFMCTHNIYIYIYYIIYTRIYNIYYTYIYMHIRIYKIMPLPLLEKSSVVDSVVDSAVIL